MTQFETDVDGRSVHPAVTDMAEHLSGLKVVHDVQINWWESGRLQVWFSGNFAPSDFYAEVDLTQWTVRHSETRTLDGVERGYAELTPTGFDPTAFSQAGGEADQ